MWAITPEERGKHDKQFDSLAPVLGYVSGGRTLALRDSLCVFVVVEVQNQ